MMSRYRCFNIYRLSVSFQKEFGGLLAVFVENGLTDLVRNNKWERIYGTLIHALDTLNVENDTRKLSLHLYMILRERDEVFNKQYIGVALGIIRIATYIMGTDILYTQEKLVKKYGISDVGLRLVELVIVEKLCIELKKTICNAIEAVILPQELFTLIMNMIGI